MSNIAFTSLACSVVAAIGLGMAFREPLVRVADTYDIHLFPSDDALNYRVSDLHKHSQNLHIATAFFLGVSIFLNAGTLIYVKERSDAMLSKIALMVDGLTTILYTAALWTLIVVGKRVKDTMDDLPIPVPDVKVDLGLGSHMEIVGYTSILIGTGLTGIVASRMYSRRNSYAPL